MRTRYQVAIVSAGSSLKDERERLVRSLVNMGHLPIDLVAAEALSEEHAASMDRHIRRSDYLVVVLSAGSADSDADMTQVERVTSLALDEQVPVLGLTFGSRSDTDKLEGSTLGKVLTRIEASRIGMVRHIEVHAQTLQALNELLDSHERPGWVSALELPSEDVASELLRLSKENAALSQKLAAMAEPDALREARWEATVRTMEENKLLIPVWNKVATVWEQPIEMTLYTFFIRIGPQLATELSAADAVEFIPTGVCQLESRDGRPPWVVPLHSLNLWLTDLMALQLVRPSRRKRPAKDQNQYWRLTGEGRAFLSYVRRSALQSGGHRHVGFTQEFPIVKDPTQDGG